jgi:hypothetical protein
MNYLSRYAKQIADDGADMNSILSVFKLVWPESYDPAVLFRKYAIE